MFVIARKTEVRVRKTIDNENMLQDVSGTLLNKIAIENIEGTDFSSKLHAEYNVINYLYEGELLLEINNKQYTLIKGDAFFIEKGMTYVMRGTFKAMCLNRTVYVD